MEKKDHRTFAFVSLGCPKNLVDSERMLGKLAQEGYVLTPEAAGADVVVVNTCGFIEPARQESLGVIREMLDLKRQEAVEIVHRLVKTADVVVENFRPGVMARFGLEYPKLRAVNPAIVYCAISGYGQTGPYAERAGQCDQGFQTGSDVTGFQPAEHPGADAVCRSRDRRFLTSPVTSPALGLSPRTYSHRRPLQREKRLSQVMFFQRCEPSVFPVAAGTGRY